MSHKRVIPDGADAVIAWAYRRGKTLQEIGDFFGVTRERIRQIMRRAGVDADQGGASLRSFANQAEKRRIALALKQKSIRKQERYFGCDYAFIRSLCIKSPWGDTHKNRGSPITRYIQQRRNAESRGIEWRLSLAEWWRLWQDSGKWQERGRGNGYSMCRLGDSGPYSVDNVYITTGVENVKDFHAVAENKARWRAAAESARQERVSA